MFVGGLFTALPKMINASVSALNTVPGKLRNFKRIDFLLSANDMFKSGRQLLNYNLLNRLLQ